jgi:hypothetical protein
MEQYDRDARDVGTSEPFARERETLVPMSALGVPAVSDGDPDIRGWDVRTVSGRQLGAVGDLLVDAQSGEVVLIDVDLHGTDRHTFVPIRVVRIDNARRTVLMDSADLPSANVARTRRDVGRRAVDVGTVRYPRTERQAFAERPRLGDEPVRRDVAASADAVDAADRERRRSERRHIDRMSTEF